MNFLNGKCCKFKSFTKSDYSVILYTNVQEIVEKVGININLINFLSIGISFFPHVYFFQQM